MRELLCRACFGKLNHSVLDLGMSPMANNYLSFGQIHEMEPFYPLELFFCETCYLIQLPVFEGAEQIFRRYAYFSSYSETLLQHSREYVQAMIARFHLSSSSQVVEVASNDGYLLRYFIDRGMNVLGVEPARNIAQAALAQGIPTIMEFFGQDLVPRILQEHPSADLLIGNNVLAHVPELQDFVAGLTGLLSPGGILTMEFPHLLQLIEKCQFDTIYHEHFSYFSLMTVRQLFADQGIRIFDVDEIDTHGGSLRIYGCHDTNARLSTLDRVERMVVRERAAELHRLEGYGRFARRVREVKQNILRFFVDAKSEGKSIACYGAPAKGNTLLNYCGVDKDFIDYAVDRNPHKQNHFLPGTHIPVHAPERLKQSRPDFVVIMPWNIRREIMDQVAHIREWGGRFVTLIPDVRLHS